MQSLTPVSRLARGDGVKAPGGRGGGGRGRGVLKCGGLVIENERDEWVDGVGGGGGRGWRGGCGLCIVVSVKK